MTRLARLLLPLKLRPPLLQQRASRATTRHVRSACSLQHRQCQPRLPPLRVCPSIAVSLSASCFHRSCSPLLAPPSPPPASSPSSELIEFKLADVGEGIAECEVVRWFVAAGDRIAQFDKVCEVQSDKANVEITSRYDGVVRELRYRAGEMAKVGQPLMVIEVQRRGAAAAGAEAETRAAVSGKDIIREGKRARDFTAPVLSAGSGRSEEELLAAGYPLSSVPSSQLSSLDESGLVDGAREEAEAGQRQTEADDGLASAEDVEDSLAKVQTSPAVRRLAKELSINLTRVRGSGPHGRILKEDLINYSQSRSSNAAARTASSSHDAAISRRPPSLSHSSSVSFSPFLPSSSVTAADRFPTTTLSPPHSPSSSPPALPAYLTADQSVPVSGLQRVMVQSMTAANAVPHFTFAEELNLDALSQLREELKPALAAQGLKLSLLPLLVKALSLSLRSFPQLNAHVNADCTAVTHRAHHNVGIAMDTAKGLLVPNIKQCQHRSILSIAQELQRLTALARAGQLSRDDLQGGTITLSNIGSIGGTYMSPVLVVPEVCIAALGSVRLLPRFDAKGQVVARKVINVSWAGDHRVVDGATMARFNHMWKGFIEQPSRMLLELH